MGRKNRRWKNKPHLPPWTTELVTPKIRNRCAYCGRLLDACEYHWMYDEFGQCVRKCKNERICSGQRKKAAEEAFREALRHNHKGKGYWIMG